MCLRFFFILQLWIERINAGAREHGTSYSRFVHGLVQVCGRISPSALFCSACSRLSSHPRPDRQADVQLNRKVMAELAVHEPKSFAALTALAQEKQKETMKGLRGLL